GAGESVLAGGRYDKLISRFDTDIPATGFGVNMSTVVDTLIRTGKSVCEKNAPKEIVSFEAGCLGVALDYCATNPDSELSPFTGAEEALKYARENGIGAVRHFGYAGETVTAAGSEV
ncbi:MAG: ATP phosphoribosyltransferase regulatory subunit, partial [Clostridia bacterium]|nr:ATP phosphoribosyltransferase regulatory subunit [Clostridia bacterium]